MTPFHWQPRHFRTLDDFRGYLAVLAKPSWVKGATVHHTWSPVPSTWRGLDSMKGIGTYYRDTRKWDRGPHLFLCAGAKKPADDGIFIGTPLTMTGIHAGVCNETRVGIEIVGNYDKHDWSSATADLVYGTLEALAAWGRFNHTMVNGHSECLPNKSCPGKKIDMYEIRTTLQKRMYSGSSSTVAEWPPHIPFDPKSPIGKAWLESLNTRSWGSPTSGETPRPDGAVRQWFERTVVTLHADRRLQVQWRGE